jgi:5-methylcytosine-specific restriction protein A
MRSPRAEFSKDTKARAFLRSKGKCECGCGKKALSPEYDHYPVPAALGGSNELSNCRVLDVKCHRLITRTKDIKTISKCNRIYEKSAGIRTKTGRPIPGSKRSGLRKLMNGTVVRRDNNV